MSLLLVTISTEIELNPGRASFPCGFCGLDVLDDNPANSCDDCQQWFHIHCQDISLDTYHSIVAEDVSFAWSCLKCDQPNYCTMSNQSLSSFHSENNFSVLSSDSENVSHSTSSNSSRFSRPRLTQLKTCIY